MYISLLIFTGIILFILGIFWRMFPASFQLPRYGYKSERALRSEAHWKLANRTASGLLLLAGILNLLLGILLSWMPIEPQADIIICTAASAATAMGFIYFTEQKLKKLD